MENGTHFINIGKIKCLLHPGFLDRSLFKTNIAFKKNLSLVTFWSGQIKKYFFRLTLNKVWENKMWSISKWSLLYYYFSKARGTVCIYSCKNSFYTCNIPGGFSSFSGWYELPNFLKQIYKETTYTIFYIFFCIFCNLILL